MNTGEIGKENLVMAGNAVSGVSTINGHPVHKNKSDCDKLVLGLSGGAISTIIGAFGVTQFQTKISMKAVRQNAIIMQTKERPHNMFPSKRYISFNKQAVDEIADFIHNDKFRQWAYDRGNSTVTRHNSFIDAHNLKCANWEKNTMRGYLKKALVGAKRARVTNNIVGVIYTGFALGIAAWTANKCME